mgnify:CR=1 FL=1
MKFRPVPVAEGKRRGKDRLHRGFGDPADPSKDFRRLRLLESELPFVAELLVAASAASPVRGTARFDPVGRRLQDPQRSSAGEGLLDLEDLHFRQIARHGERDEDDLPVDPSDALAAEGRSADRDLDDIAPFHAAPSLMQMVFFLSLYKHPVCW